MKAKKNEVYYEHTISDVNLKDETKNFAIIRDNLIT